MRECKAKTEEFTKIKNTSRNKLFLRMPMITRSKLCELFYRVAEMLNNYLPGYDLFREPLVFSKNFNLLLVDILQIFKYSIYTES